MHATVSFCIWTDWSGTAGSEAGLKNATVKFSLGIWFTHSCWRCIKQKDLVDGSTCTFSVHLCLKWSKIIQNLSDSFRIKHYSKNCHQIKGKHVSKGLRPYLFFFVSEIKTSTWHNCNYLLDILCFSHTLLKNDYLLLRLFNSACIGFLTLCNYINHVENTSVYLKQKLDIGLM